MAGPCATLLFDMELSRIRNFCIIAHIDHGKSTLADRLLEHTGTVSQRVMEDQFLDQMDLERERGITIKAHTVTMSYRAQDGVTYELNLIDTPGHVDFSYEVSRSLAACEGAILVVDATQGIQAQTLANAYGAINQNLAIIPVVNKIDLPTAEPSRVAKQLGEALGFVASEVMYASAKEGTGIVEILEAIVNRLPSPKGNPPAPLRALIFDSKYDPYKGVVAYVRLVDGSLSSSKKLIMMSTGRIAEALEVGIFKPQPIPVELLEAGEVGYVATGLKDVRECKVGDTITLEEAPSASPLAGYSPMKPMVFAGLYPVEGDDYPLLRDALDKLRLNDSSLTYEPESSSALGNGFRCGFLGLLHMEIVRERLEREFNLNLLITSPGVAYQVVQRNGMELLIDNPSALPNPSQIQEIREPWLALTIITPSRFIGPMMELMAGHRGEYEKMEYLDSGSGESGEPVGEPSQDPRVLLQYTMPLREMLADFYDDLKSRSQGYASLDYSLLAAQAAPLVKLEILVHNQAVDALSTIVHEKDAYQQGKALVERLKTLIPRQLFEVPIQAAIGGRIIARESIKPLRKNVLAKCYGGDITRKRKLLERQAEGKKRMKMIGSVEIPQEAFLALLKRR